MVEFEEIKCHIKDIKSSYNLEGIFSFLEQIQKLNIIIYNKNLQMMLGVNLHDYKNISKRYKIGEKNGKGSEYTLNTNKLIFEGEYINGRRNGKGKEYCDYNGELKFEGEYLDGKRKGKGKEYLIGELKFEGLYFNGQRNGIGKEYYNNGNLKFEGEYLNGKRWNGKGYNKNGITDFEIKDGNGKGKEYYDDGELQFEGEYLNGERNGKGKEYSYYSDGELEFEGEYLNGKRWNGKGYNKNGFIDLQIKDGKYI